MRRIICLLLVLACATPLFAAKKEKGKFDLFLNGINKGYEKYKVQEKKGEKVISSEIRFKLPMPKAKRGYVELYLYPVLTLNESTGKFEGYNYRMTYNDFTNMEMVEARDSATEVIDQDWRHYDLFHRDQQLQDDQMKNRIDLGVNAGEVEPIGQTLHFKQMRFSNSRVKDEPLPKHVTILDAYTFTPYLVLAKEALAMKGESKKLSIVLPQAMGLKEGRLEYMGTDRTPVGNKEYILKHYNVNIGNSPLSSFWIDKAGKVVQVIIPSEGLIAILSDYTPKPFEHEIPRIFKQSVEVGGGFQESRVHIASGDITLGATLTLPSGAGPFPTVLLVQDLEPLNRDGNDPDNPYSRAGTWKQLAYYLASEGFASLRYDSRGVGETGGDSQKLMIGDVTKDVVNMVKWLENQPSTKGGTIALLSQGLGGWAAARAAVDMPVKGLVAIGYPAKDIARLWREQVSGMIDPQARQQAYLDLDNLDAVLGAKGQEWFKFRGRKVFVPGVRAMNAVDPLALASSLKVPCLFVYPDKDRIVMPFHKDVLADSLHKGQEEMVLKGLGHHLTQITDNDRSTGIVDGKKLEPVTEWLKKLFAGAPASSP